MTTIKIIENGPLIITAEELKIVEGEKQHFKLDQTVAYCRCGKSKNQPYCDGSHKQTDTELV